MSIKVEIAKDLPCRSILLKVEGRTEYFCALIYENVAEALPRQVVVLEVTFVDGKPTGREIIGEEHMLGDAQWEELKTTPDVWFGKWLSRNHRKVFGFPAPGGGR